ncbi:MAG: hypothetical protein BZY88_13295 [SAR202 cluster bacterium Io17-Chloro-G9]|nr:MAG: hypothetical protein BZY88_13295 [SAR202 cluster bacterium Io17-Chloro-G9]
MALGDILIRGPRIIDPGQGLDQIGDVLIRDGVILAAGRSVSGSVPEGARIIEAADLVASPGFIDMHCHLRVPGFEHKETVASGTRAAAHGGFTTLCCMPNTQPAIDSRHVVEQLQQRFRDEAVVRVYPIGCVTKGRQGEEIAPLDDLAAAGVVAFSDDGDPVYDPNLMRLALTRSVELGLPISNHCQERTISLEGVMADGETARRLGLPGIPAAAEETMMARDISLAQETGGRLHVAHVSSAGTIPLLRRARELGLAVSAEVCPHHLTITDRWALGNRGAEPEVQDPLGYDTSTKVYPPLRTQADVDALVEGLAEGLIDCIATDHAPHDQASKQCGYEDAAFGISVLETALGSALQLVHHGRLSLTALVERMTVGPANALGPAFTELGTLRNGTPADIVLFDPGLEWVVDTGEFESMGRNTPLQGTGLKGRVMATLVAGEVVFQDKTRWPVTDAR